MDENEKEDKRHIQVVDGVEHAASSGEVDWNPDSFPTSAKPIFRAVGLLVGLVIALCFAAYSCSEEDPNKPEPKAVENPLDDSEAF